MNAEISKMRRIRNGSELFDHKPQRIPEIEMLRKVKEINTNYRQLYELQYRDNIDINEFVAVHIANIHIVLNIFDEMGIYPDYFYDGIINIKTDYVNKHKMGKCNLRDNYHLYHEVNYSKMVENGLRKGYYHIKSYPVKDINDIYSETSQYFDKLGIPHGTNTKEACNNVFNDLKIHHFTIIDDLINSDDIYEDVECLSKLLFEYLSFFVSMGINPKEYLEKEDEIKKK